VDAVNSIWRLLAVGLVAVVIACAPGPPRVIPRSGGVGVEQGVVLGWAWKRVLTKDPPATLVAEDGTVCRVAPDRYADTKVGRGINCDWQLGNPEP
jgi:hypothetical protein